MKKIILIMIIGILLSAQYTSAQKDSSGIYKTSADFQQRKLTYAINYRTETHKIKSNMIFNSKEIKVKHDGIIYTLKKEDTYGYRDARGIDYRFMGYKELKVLNTGEPILLYFYQHTAHSPKDQAAYKPEYYFSKDVNSTPEKLTLSGVKAAFPKNHKFHDALDAQFKSDDELYSYDSFHKMYKLSWIFVNTQGK